MNTATSTTPLIGGSKTLPKSNGRTPTFVSKAKGKSNSSILNFFKKADSGPSSNGNNKEDEDSLFLEDSPTGKAMKQPVQTPTPPRESISPESPSSTLCQTATDSEKFRFNEDFRPVKRRRVERPPLRSPSRPNNKVEGEPKKGAFIEDSDSENDVPGHFLGFMPTRAGSEGIRSSVTPKSEESVEDNFWAVDPHKTTSVPSLQRDNTSIVERDEFEGLEDFIDDEFPEEGEEFLERQWMEEQKELEMGMEDEDPPQDLERGNSLIGPEKTIQDSAAPSCPICSGSFDGLTDQVG